MTRWLKARMPYSARSYAGLLAAREMEEFAKDKAMASAACLRRRLTAAETELARLHAELLDARGKLADVAAENRRFRLGEILPS